MDDVIACALSYMYKDFNGASSWLWSPSPDRYKLPQDSSTQIQNSTLYTLLMQIWLLIPWFLYLVEVTVI